MNRKKYNQILTIENKDRTLNNQYKFNFLQNSQKIRVSSNLRAIFKIRK